MTRDAVSDSVIDAVDAAAGMTARRRVAQRARGVEDGGGEIISSRGGTYTGVGLLRFTAAVGPAESEPCVKSESEAGKLFVFDAGESSNSPSVLAEAGESVISFDIHGLLFSSKALSVTTSRGIHCLRDPVSVLDLSVFSPVASCLPVVTSASRERCDANVSLENRRRTFGLPPEGFFGVCVRDDI